MGFYTPSKLLQYARRRGVKALPADVTISSWNSTLEGDTTAAPARLGMSLIKRIRAETAERIQLARAVRSFVDVADLERRAALHRHDLTVLAHAGTLRSLTGSHRRDSIWTAAAAMPESGILRGTERDDVAPALPVASKEREIVTDYRAMCFTLSGHPLELLRDRLRADRLLPARELAQLRNGQFARACGIVTVRQRQGTAKGVLFITLEDETGQTNVIVRPAMLEKYRRGALGASLLAVYGVWQIEGRFHHLAAKELRDRTELLGALRVESHDFH